ncbi:hypothetical protein SAMN02745898_11179 [Streptomyces sp. 136MFCol5.1]|nr:hypothetical protein SAMN02745898_11179 [Streptomyces sp. 136MFCol5.1]
MLMEAHLPEGGATPLPAAAQFADALRRATEQGAKDVRERRVPCWGAVREALAQWDEDDRLRGQAADPVVRNGAGLLLETLEEFSRGLDGSTSGPAGADGAGRD